MKFLLRLWNQPNWFKWVVYFAIAYILFTIKEAFAIVLWFLFCILLYYIIFAKNMFQSTTYYEKKYSILILCALLISCNTHISDLRPHGSQSDTPELTRNNYLMGFLNEYRSSYDITYYDINIDFDIEQKSIDGFVTIKAKSLDDIDTLQVDLAKNLNIKNITYEDNMVEYSREEDAVLVFFNQTIDKDTLFDFTVHYNGIPQSADNPPWAGGFTWSKDKNDRDWIAVSCEGEGARIWWPNKDHISEEPDSVRMAFTVPSELMGIGNGQLRSVVEKEDDKTTYEWFVNNPINNYNISVQIGNYVAIQDTFIKENTTHYMNHYVLDYNREVAQNYFLQSKEVIRFYEKYFGDYQWWNDGYKLIEVPYLGMEHQSAVTYGNGFSIYNGVRSDSWPMYGVIDPLIMHESGHEWFGNSVTAIDPTHIWIHEGLQVYSEALYFEDKFDSYSVSIDYLKSIKSRIQNKIPIVGPEDENYWALNGDTYMKGAWVMHTLRSAIDDDSTWFAILKEFMVENAKGHVSTEDFFDKVKFKTGVDYSYFSEQYFYTPNQPELQYYQTDSSFHYKWNNVNDSFTMPMSLLVNGIEKRVLPSKEFQSFDIKKHTSIEVMDWKFYVKPIQIR